MNLQLFGINHKTSDVSERERFIIDESTQIFLENYLKDKFPHHYSIFLLFQLVIELKSIHSTNQRINS